MRINKNQYNCCGCTACANICPRNAITMAPDALGFKYPKIDLALCIDCGLCEKVCAFNSEYDKTQNYLEPKTYAARHKELKEIETSRSGAAFIALSDIILEEGGAIYGAGYKDHFVVAHKRAITKKERDEFKGSKYTQSDLGSIFQSVKQDLTEGKTVLFSGTPCQTAGLNAFINKKLKDKLYLIDIVCHGVPSPYIWRDYITYLENLYQSKVTTVNFRDKSELGWAAHKESFCFENGTKATCDNFTYLFYKHIMFRHSCEKCPFANIHRPSDITIADFWGWQKTDAIINADDKGVSLLLINTEKENSLFNKANKNLYIIKANLENCLQPNLKNPSKSSPQRIKFEQTYLKHGFKGILKKYGNIGFAYTFHQLIIRIINKIRFLFKK